METEPLSISEPRGERDGRAGFRLRYASHLGITSTEAPLFGATLKSTDPVLHIEYAAAQGFAGVEDNFLRNRTVAEQLRIGEALGRHGMEMGCFALGLDLDRPIWCMSDADSQERVDAEVAAAIELAKRVDGKYIVMAPARHPSLPQAYQRAALVRHLRRVAPQAERAGVILCLEQTSSLRLPNMLLHHMPDAYGVANAVESPAVKLLFDFYHVQMMDGHVLGHLDQAWDEVAIVQVGDVPNRSEIGISELNWVAILRALIAKGYDGLIEYEIFPSRPGAEGEQAALAALRAIDAQL